MRTARRSFVCELNRTDRRPLGHRKGRGGPESTTSRMVTTTINTPILPPRHASPPEHVGCRPAAVVKLRSPCAIQAAVVRPVGIGTRLGHTGYGRTKPRPTTHSRPVKGTGGPTEPCNTTIPYANWVRLSSALLGNMRQGQSGSSVVHPAPRRNVNSSSYPPASSTRNASSVRVSPSSSDVCGAHFNKRRAFAMSGRRRCGSSIGSSS